ncbi:hypothetical protein TWF506_009454 [Arthrobotrys conoides]|uniref:Uncharacterized protein n=1 Tax=Arthrobotrys conoides TaxID=74498 RepID=A0AAN8PCF2_9PEZI
MEAKTEDSAETSNGGENQKKKLGNEPGKFRLRSGDWAGISRDGSRERHKDKAMQRGPGGGSTQMFTHQALG